MQVSTLNLAILGRLSLASAYYIKQIDQPVYVRTKWIHYTKAK